MLVLYALFLLVMSVASDSWDTKFAEKECYRCARYEYDKAHFSSLLPISNDAIVIGAKNTVYKIEFEYTKVTPFADERISNTAYQNCKDSGRSEDDCQNYYKVLIQITDNDLMMCGTSSFQPTCDIRHIGDLSFKSRSHVLTGEAICPSDPTTPTSVIVLDQEKTVGFSATCIDECTDYQISRINLLPGSLSYNGHTMKTTDWLNSPTFVYSFQEGEYVYFLFYETAVEVKSERVYSRVARLCKNDIGSGQEYFSNYFLSYSKARIYCTSYKPGEAPFNHDEIGGAHYKDGILYAVFSGQRNLRTGSILCSYQIRDIDEVFDGPYLKFDEVRRKWVAAQNEPFSCSKKKSISGALTLTMMQKSISQNEPLYYTETETRLTSVAVISKRVKEVDYTVIYAGSESGYVVRVGLEKGLTGNTHSSIIKTGASGSVNSLTISKDTNIIYALSSNWVTRIPTFLEDGCKFASTCNECLDLYYPYCSWCKTGGEMRCIADQSECIVTDLVLPTETCLPLPIFRNSAQDLAATRGNNVVFECAGRDREVASWQREDGAPISHRARYTSDALIIPAVDLVDMGCYVCSLNNTSGRVSSTGCLIVTEKPYFTMEPENISAFEEDVNIELQCEAAGSPLPEIEWFKEGAQIPDGSEVTEQGFLRIYRVLSEDQGYYWCTATNSEGSLSSKRGYLKVTEGAMENTVDIPVPDSMPRVTMVGMVVAIVVSAVICFAIGLIVHKLYRKHRKKRISNDHDQTQTPHGFDGRVHTRGPWTPINTLPYQMCHAEEWRDSGMYSCTYPNTMGHPPPLPLRSELLAQMTHNTENTLLEEDEAPPAYDERHSDSPPLLPPTPVSLQAPMCFPPNPGRYTPTHFNTCPSHPGISYCPHHIPSTSHYTSLNSDYAVIAQPSTSYQPQQAPPTVNRQYSMDLNVQAAQNSNNRQLNNTGDSSNSVARPSAGRVPSTSLLPSGYNNQVI